MGLEADVALDRVGLLRTPGLDCLLSLAAEIFLDCVAIRRDSCTASPSVSIRNQVLPFGVSQTYCISPILIAAILGRRARKARMSFSSRFDLCVFTQPGSIASLWPRAVLYRSTPVNGYRQTASACLNGPTGDMVPPQPALGRDRYFTPFW